MSPHSQVGLSMSRKSAKSNDSVKPIWNELDKLKKDFNRLELKELEKSSSTPPTGRHLRGYESETTLNEEEEEEDEESLAEYASEDENCLRLVNKNSEIKLFIRNLQLF
jgi:hypothetical protein